MCLANFELKVYLTGGFLLFMYDYIILVFMIIVLEYRHVLGCEREEVGERK